MALLASVPEELLEKNWYVIHTKPRQEQRALSNLQQQGYQCYLPIMAIEKLTRERVTVIEEPLFPRYLFICLDAGRHGQNWSPIRSTWGVSGLVTFGATPAKVDNRLINLMRQQEQGLSQEPERLFAQGETLLVADGPFAGLEAIYQMPSGENRAMVLIELMGKSAQMQIAPASLRKVG
jgi:transcriptional antiterminator RfaH